MNNASRSLFSPRRVFRVATATWVIYALCLALLAVTTRDYGPAIVPGFIALCTTVAGLPIGAWSWVAQRDQEGSPRQRDSQPIQLSSSGDPTAVLKPATHTRLAIAALSLLIALPGYVRPSPFGLVVALISTAIGIRVVAMVSVRARPSGIRIRRFLRTINLTPGEVAAVAYRKPAYSSSRLQSVPPGRVVTVYNQDFEPFGLPLWGSQPARCLRFVDACKEILGTAPESANRNNMMLADQRHDERKRRLNQHLMDGRIPYVLLFLPIAVISSSIRKVEEHPNWIDAPWFPILAVLFGGIGIYWLSRIYQRARTDYTWTNPRGQASNSEAPRVY